MTKHPSPSALWETPPTSKHHMVPICVWGEGVSTFWIGKTPTMYNLNIVDGLCIFNVIILVNCIIHANFN